MITLKYAATRSQGACGLLVSMIRKLPIRVFRSSNLVSHHAPPPYDDRVSYRYDGLYFVKAAYDSTDVLLIPTTGKSVRDVISSDDLPTKFVLVRSSNMSKYSNIVFMQKMGLTYETYMSKLGFRFDMYANVDAYGNKINLEIW